MRRRHFLQALAGATAAACGATQATPSPSPSPSPSHSPTPSPSPSPAASASPTPTLGVCSKDAAGKILFIDTHAHLDARTPTRDDYDGAAEAALAADDASGAKATIVMPPPFSSSDGAYDYTAYQVAAMKRAPRVAFLGGGGTLNPMIQEAIKAGSVSPELRTRFQAMANQILGGGAVGFGEMTAEHLSFNPRHPYVSAPPDHELFLLLVDIGARINVPIDMHMVAVTQDQPMFPQFRQASPNNPATLKENITRFEKLLDRNKAARIVWAHAGEQFVGCGDSALAQRLLAAHPNLYLQLKPQPSQPGQVNSLVDGAGKITAAWLSLIRAFPDRMFLGGDNFWSAPGAQTPFQRPANDLPAFRAFVDQLPAEVACKVASENAGKVYRL